MIKTTIKKSEPNLNFTNIIKTSKNDFTFYYLLHSEWKLSIFYPIYLFSDAKQNYIFIRNIHRLLFSFMHKFLLKFPQFFNIIYIFILNLRSTNVIFRHLTKLVENNLKHFLL